MPRYEGFEVATHVFTLRCLAYESLQLMQGQIKINDVLKKYYEITSNLCMAIKIKGETVS